MQTFWQQLTKPIIGLSPLDGITDTVCRKIQKKYGHPDVMFTEFTSVEGLCHGADRLLKDFLYTEEQRPIIAQLFGTTPNFFRQAAIAASELGFDGIDINMGCPAKSVVDHGAGAALIQTPALAKNIVRATKLGLEDYLNGKRSQDCTDISPKISQEIKKRAKLLPLVTKQQSIKIPVSIKTRIGYQKIVTHDWISILLETEPDLITVHGRLLMQGYGGAANWEEIALAAQLIHQDNKLILGNGDVDSYQDAVEKSNLYHTDGVLIGRASLGNPFVFLKNSDVKNHGNIYQVALEHARLYEQTYHEDAKYNFLPMRKHLGWYVKGIGNASQIRVKLMNTNSSQEVEKIFKDNQLIE